MCVKLFGDETYCTYIIVGIIISHGKYFDKKRFDLKNKIEGSHNQANTIAATHI